MVTGLLRFYEVRTAQELEERLAVANGARQTEATEPSPSSSRTHLLCILRTLYPPWELFFNVYVYIEPKKILNILLL